MPKDEVARHGLWADLASVPRQHGLGLGLHDFAAGTRYLSWSVGVDDLEGFSEHICISEYEERVMRGE